MKIKSIKELEVQIALGAITPCGNVPKNIKATTKVRRFLVGGKVHSLLREAVRLRRNIITRKEISNAVCTQYSSTFIAHAEIFGFIERLCPYEPQNGRRGMSFRLTKLGRHAAMALQYKRNHNRRGYVQVEIKINLDAINYHIGKQW